MADRAGFSPDGSLISAIISYTVPVCCDARTGEQKWASIPLGNFVTDLCWREDSRALAVISEWSHTVCVLDADTGDRIEEMIGIDASEAPLVSAKEGIGIDELLEAIVHTIPAPEADPDARLKALIFGILRRIR